MTTGTKPFRKRRKKTGYFTVERGQARSSTFNRFTNEQVSNRLTIYSDIIKVALLLQEGRQKCRTTDNNITLMNDELIHDYLM